MKKCKECSWENEEGPIFCAQCGSRLEPPQEESVMTCASCGVSLAPEARFCGACGAPTRKNAGDLSDEAPTMPVPVPPVPDITAEAKIAVKDAWNKTSALVKTKINEGVKKVTPLTPPLNPDGSMDGAYERELYKKALVNHNRGALRTITGSLLITNRRLVFTPLPIHVGARTIALPMASIVEASRARVVGMNLGLKVRDTGGNEYTFAPGVFNMDELQRIVDLINQHKEN